MSVAPTAGAPAAWSLPARTRFSILGAALLALFLAALDQTIVATALPAIVSQFHGIDLAAWVSIGYLLSSTAMVPIYGRLSDSHGRRGVLVFGVIVFLIGSALCGISGGMLSLILDRVLQGVGAAAITSTAFAIPADLFPPIQRARYMGFFGAVFGIASVIGPWVGGVLTDHLSWRWVFYVNLPIGAIVMVLILTRMPSLGARGGEPLDLRGTGLMIATVVPLLLGLSLDPRVRVLGVPATPWLLGLACVAGVLYVVAERRAAHPVIPLSLFQNRTFASIAVSSLLIGASFIAAVLFLSLFMVNALGSTASGAGTAIVPLTFGVVFAGIATSFLVHRTRRYKGFMVGGLAVMAVGFAWASRMTAATSHTSVILRMILIGIGAGPAMPTLNIALQNAVPHTRIGIATAARQFYMLIGQALGAALFGMILSVTLTDALERNLTPALAALPPVARAVVDRAEFRHSGTGREGAAGPHAEVHARMVAAVNRDLETRRPPATDPQALARWTTTRDAELHQLDDAWARILLAVRASFAAAVTRVYALSVAFALGGMLILLIWLPELPLREGHTPEPVAE